MALRHLSKVSFSFVNPEPSAQRVLWWYSKIFFFSKPPLLVMSVSERKKGDDFANISAAVRTLTEYYGVRVVVDGISLY
jgi:hypothetical protein